MSYLDSLRARRCPYCAAPDLIPGPRGGASQNFYCDRCGLGWNLHGVDYGGISYEPLGPIAPDLITLYRNERDARTGLLPQRRREP